MVEEKDVRMQSLSLLMKILNARKTQPSYTNFPVECLVRLLKIQDAHLQESIIKVLECYGNGVTCFVVNFLGIRSKPHKLLVLSKHLDILSSNKSISSSKIAAIAWIAKGAEKREAIREDIRLMGGLKIYVDLIHENQPDEVIEGACASIQRISKNGT